TYVVLALLVVLLRARIISLASGTPRNRGQLSLAVGGGAAVMIRRWKGESSGAASGHSDRWHTVTINRPSDEVSANGRLPEPLAKLGDKIEVQVRPAPGDRGTEVAARLREPVPSGPGGAAARLKGQDPRGPVRRALRDSRALLETGEVLSPTSRQRPTPVRAES
ncbi:hypothetical protein ABTZ90_33680, partial [Streptomyces cellulosae]